LLDPPAGGIDMVATIKTNAELAVELQFGTEGRLWEGMMRER